MSKPLKYRKKPVVVEAVQWLHPDDHSKVGYWRYPPVDPKTGEISAKDDAINMGQLRHSSHSMPDKFRRETCDAFMDDHGYIDTLEGGHTVCPGNYIITGVQGECYPCREDIFVATYEQEDQS